MAPRTIEYQGFEWVTEPLHWDDLKPGEFWLVWPVAEGPDVDAVARFHDRLGELPERILQVETYPVKGGPGGAWIEMLYLGPVARP